MPTLRATGAAAAPVTPPPARAAPLTAPDKPGGHGVGFHTVTIVDAGRHRTLVTSIWYPTGSRLPAPGAAATADPANTAAAGAAAGAAGAAGLTGAAAGRSGTAAGPPVGDGAVPARYEIAPEVSYQSRVAVADAPPERGPFPLVVFSHGSAGSRVQFASLAEALASRGYVVAAPDHPGDTMADVAAGPNESLIDLAGDRPMDVSAVLDWMLCPGRPFASILSADKVAVVGFSFGGLTAIASSVGLLRAPADPRVRVSVGISPASAALPASLLARVRIPTLLIAGTADGVTPPGPGADRTFRELTGSPGRAEVVVTGATHNSFSDLCDQVYLTADGRVPAAIRLRMQLGALLTCLPPLADAAFAQQVARWYTVAYLERHLRGDTRYDRYLTPTAAATQPLPVTVRSAP
ncbi:alpha/beta hydrolase family protein [Pseudofrankia asymbiotica]|uniref:alpha/beta hydrolase family protein n=1 Tax=Pseudofrankia asymbiotica TaxID=1834516 RepID=UPI001F5286A1|nr:alpha/beta fold hydrolase [Pseudofrankia asymbiotica]